MLMLPKGNLLKNPGFELGLRFWEVPQTLPFTEKRNVSARAEFPHSGFAALGLNELAGEFLSVVYQDVRVSPGKCYELDFVASGGNGGSARIWAEVRWLDDDDEDLGAALALYVPETGLACDGQWSLYTGITDEAPLGARRARISFASRGGCLALVDDTAFYKTE